MPDDRGGDKEREPDIERIPAAGQPLPVETLT
jgi:hypothetical protein